MKLELNKHDRICFLGDSITQNGQWIAEVFEYFKKHYSELEIGFYNSGIAGTSASQAHLKNRMHCDCLHLFPKYTVIMFGMNDIGRELYLREDAENLMQRKERIEQYLDALNKILKTCKKAGTIPILCSPTPYDEYNEPDEGTGSGLDTALELCTHEVEKISRENNLLFVDMHKALLEYIDKKPIGADRVHPNMYGHHLMAECFLCAIGAKMKSEPDKVIEIRGRSKERFQTEQKLRHIVFLERHFMGWQHREDTYTLAERKEFVRQRLGCEKTEWIKELLEEYIEIADFQEDLRGKLIKQTLEMYLD